MKFLLVFIFLISTFIYSSDSIFLKNTFYNLHEFKSVTINSKVESELLTLLSKKYNSETDQNRKYILQNSFQYSPLVHLSLIRNPNNHTYFLVSYLYKNNSPIQIYDYFEFPLTNFIEYVNNYAVYFDTLLTINTTDIFLFSGNKINQFQIDSSGKFITKQSMKIDGSFQISLIDDYFPYIKHLYFYLNGSLEFNKKSIYTLLKNLNSIETFGVFHGNSFILDKTLLDNLNNVNCNTLKNIVTDQSFKFEILKDYDSTCPNLSNIFLSFIADSNENESDNLTEEKLNQIENSNFYHKIKYVE